ncbi:MAG: hypothetical protein U1E53_04920 [Dongiaceae bacterium]
MPEINHNANPAISFIFTCGARLSGQEELAAGQQIGAGRGGELALP